VTAPDTDPNLAAWIARHARLRPDAPALADEARRLDYAGLDRRVQRCAGVLREHGVDRGDRVALVLGNGSPYLEAVFAASRLGAIAVPLNARLTAPELRFLIGDCRPRFLLCDAAHAAAAEAACQGLGAPPPRLACGGEPDAYEAALAACAPVEAIAPVSPEDPVILMYTSGTTGAPKGALLPQRKALYNCLNAEIFFGLTPADRVLTVLPLFHSFGLQILSLPALHAGASVVLQAHFDPERVWQTVGREGITYLGGVPTMFRALLRALEAAPAGSLDLASLRFLFTAGAAIPVELIHAFQAHGLVLKQGFGQTETSILCCLDAADAVRKAGSVGRPVRHAEVRVVGLAELPGPPETWRDVAPGETGEIVVRGPITMIGYWERPEATAEVLRGEWLRTGDLATRDAEGFVTLVGRARHMYISGGENVYPAEIERAYEAHPAIREIAVVGVPDEQWGEVGHAYCVMAPGATFDEAELRAWGRQRLADFKLPRRFFRVESLPRTETGKVKVFELPGARASARPPIPAGDR
jgi:fatty-acyl-CoA synthase